MGSHPPSHLNKNVLLKKPWIVKGFVCSPTSSCGEKGEKLTGETLQWDEFILKLFGAGARGKGCSEHSRRPVLW